MYPKHDGDPYGVFVLDYIEVVRPECDIQVIASRARGATPLRIETRSGVTVRRFAGLPAATPAVLKPLAYLVWLVRTWGHLRRFSQYDVLHTHNIIPETTLACFFRYAHGIPVVVSIHGGPFSKHLKTWLSRVLTKWTLEHVDSVCVVSEDLGRQLRAAGIKPRALQVTYNPVNTDLFYPAPDDGAANQRILFAGRLEPYKGAVRVLRAFEAIYEDNPGWMLMIVGTGPEGAIIEQALQADSRLASRVEFVNRGDRSEIANYMRTASFVVCPSEHETFGLVCAEALASGLPVIAGDNTAQPEVVTSASGILVDATSISAIADAMQTMIERSHCYDRNQMRADVESRFGLTAFGERIKGVYRNLIATSSRARAASSTLHRSVPSV